MKKALFVLMIVIMAALLAACAARTPSPQQPAAQSQSQQPAAATQQAPMEAAAASQPAVDDQQYADMDPTSEEDDGAFTEIYAGASPIPLNPIDMPSPTPRPAMTFTFSPYTADKLRLTFEAIAGYAIDDSVPNTFKLTQPAEQVIDNVPVVITLSIEDVNNTYKSTDIKKDLRNKLDELGSVDYKTWRPSDLAQRTLLKKAGYYANYRGELYDGSIVRGRIHMALLDNNKLLTLHVSYPGWYETDYIKVVTRIRNTLKMM